MDKMRRLLRAEQLIKEHRDKVQVATYGHGEINRVLRAEFGKGLRASTITVMTNALRRDDPLTHRICGRCSRDLPLACFQWSDTLQTFCLDCRNTRDRAYYKATRERRLELRRTTYRANPDPTRGRVRRDTSIYDAVRKIQVLSHYGNGRCACVRCREDDIACLSIDHIDGSGVQHRKVVGSHFYSWLIKQGYPAGYQTLCMNCQFKKRYQEREFNTIEAIERREKWLSVSHAQ